jgi:hypothetical protein
VRQGCFDPKQCGRVSGQQSIDRNAKILGPCVRRNTNQKGPQQDSLQLNLHDFGSSLGPMP